jgi:aspartyl-tRNA(Asn)/glutamyl-tRNA(Gln) amidotransferase subunit C
MSIRREDVQRLAHLARLEFTPAEETELITHLNTLLSYVEKLNQLDTDGIEPTAHAVNIPSPFREDRVTNEPNTEALLRNAPAREDNFFKVPKIIE